MGQRPTFFEKLNAIVRFIEDPCDAPWLVYLELAKEPAVNAILTWFTFGLLDVTRGYFRPRGLRIRRHGRGKGKGGARSGRLGRVLARIPGLGDDVGNFIGKRLPGAQLVNQRQVSQGVKNLWIIDMGLQRILWWWLVIGITTDFLYEWTSLLQETKWCQRTHELGLYATGVTGGALAIQGWIAQLGMSEQRNHGGAGWSGAVATLGPGKWTVIFGNEMEQIGNGPGDHQCRIVEFVAGFPVINESATVHVSVGETGQCIATGEVTGPIQVLCQARTSFAGATGVMGDFWAAGD